MNLPSAQQHTFICGKTGSGKSVFAAWLMSQSAWKKPWIILDLKRDPLWKALQRSGVAAVQRKPPFRLPRSGITIVRAQPRVHDKELEELLWKIHKRGKSGLFVDEAYLVPNTSIAMENILTQGRSKSIQVIGCAQRPYYISMFYLSESSFMGIFKLDFDNDRRRVREFVELPRNYENPPRRHCYWADQNEDQVSRLLPCPSPRHIVAEIAERAPLPLW